MKLIDTYTGKEIAAIITNHGLTMDEAIELSGMEEVVIDPGTEELDTVMQMAMSTGMMI